MGKSKKYTKVKGITLIALVITIIVLLILAAISVTMLTGDNNIIKKAGQAADETKLAGYKEEIALSLFGSIDESGKKNLEKMKQELDKTGKYETTILGDSLVIITKKENYIFEINQDGKVEYKGIKIITSDAEPIMMGRNNNYSFWQEQYRTKITKVETRNYMTTSKNAIEEWDVSKNKNKSVMAWIEDDGNEGYILYIAANGQIIVQDLSAFFREFSLMKTCNLRAFNTGQVTDMRYMFRECKELIDINVNSFNTSNVKNMYCMLLECSKLTKIDLSNFNTENVTNMSHMFADCSELKSVNLSSFNTSNVTSMQAMYSGCWNLTELDVTNFNTAKVTNMAGMFGGCKSLSKIDVSSFDTSNVENMQSMFFSGNYREKMNLEEIKGIDKFNTEKVNNMNSMFYGCDKLKTIDLSNWKTNNVTNMNEMFKGFKIQSGKLDLSNWNIEKVIAMSGMFHDCQVNEIIMPGKNSELTSIGSIFQHCAAKKIDISGIDGSKITNVGAMFHTTAEIEYLDISSFDFSKVTSYDIFTRVSAFASNVKIYVKNQAAKDFLMNAKPSLKDENFIIRNQ